MLRNRKNKRKVKPAPLRGEEEWATLASLTSPEEPLD